MYNIRQRERQRERNFNSSMGIMFLMLKKKIYYWKECRMCVCVFSLKNKTNNWAWHTQIISGRVCLTFWTRLVGFISPLSVVSDQSLQWFQGSLLHYCTVSWICQLMLNLHVFSYEPWQSNFCVTRRKIKDPGLIINLTVLSTNDLMTFDTILLSAFLCQNILIIYFY